MTPAAGPPHLWRRLVASALVASSQRARAAETVLSSGVADASGAQGPEWWRVDFTVPESGPSTLRLSCTGTADMRFTVFNSATGQKLGGNLTVPAADARVRPRPDHPAVPA